MKKLIAVLALSAALVVGTTAPAMAAGGKGYGHVCKWQPYFDGYNWTYACY